MLERPFSPAACGGEAGYRPLLNGRCGMGPPLFRQPGAWWYAIALLPHEFCKMSKFADCADDTDSISIAAVLANQ